VIGVSDPTKNPNLWWSPDGAELAAPPCDKPRLGISFDEGVPIRAVVARVSNAEKGSAGWSLSIPGSAGSSGEVATRDGKRLQGMQVKVVGFRGNPATGTIVFTADTGPWTTVATFNGFGSGAVGNAAGPSYMYSQAYATRRGTLISVTHNIADLAVRVVAVDRQGKEHESVERGGVGLNGFSQIMSEFDGAPDNYQEYRLQKREHDRVELPGVDLRVN
jgi:hypothetical protein